MEYSGSEKQIAWAEKILPAEKIPALLDEISSFLETRTTERPKSRRASTGTFMPAAQHAWLTRKLAALRTAGVLDAATVIDHRNLLSSAEEKAQLVASAEVTGFRCLSLRHAIDRDFE